MRRPRIVVFAVLFGVLALIAGIQIQSRAGVAYAQSTLAAYAIDWFTIDGGGAIGSSSGEYALSGTIGQPDAGTLESGAYRIDGGFWPGAQARYTIAVPIVAR